MRIAIDLQACQQRLPAEFNHNVAALRTLVEAAAGAGHTALLVLHHAEDGPVTAFDAWRQALAPLAAALAPQVQLHLLHTPPGADDWRQRAGALLRATLLRDLRADVVWMAGQPGAAPRAPADLAVPTVYDEGGAGLHDFDAGRMLARLLEEAELAVPVVAALTSTAAKPRLAYLSPLPPQPSGIADYSVELLAQLEQFYDIDLIVDGPLAPALASRYAVHDGAWFAEHGGQYARRLYHFGNNGQHAHLFALLHRHPGIVVLHDFYLSAALDKLELVDHQPHALLHAMYASHGYSGVQAAARLGRNAAIWAYPCNKPVLDQATGVIVHSEASRRLAQQWYGADCAAAWQVVPLLRGLPAASAGTDGRSAARAALGLADDAFLVCSFGMMGVTKRNDVLLDAFLSSPLATDPRCVLVFVGAADAEEYGRDIDAVIAASGVSANIRITGFVSSADYANWLQATDIAVQLRSHTRGETSASVLDCLLHGVPTVINAHGANTELPADVVVLLADDEHADALAASLGTALATLYGDAAYRTALGARARAFMAAHHAPQQVGPRFRDAIETIVAHSPATHYAALRTALQQLPPAPPGALMATAAAIVANRVPAAPRQLFVDVSAMVQADLKTGIQRVVRSILLGLFEAPPPGYRIEAVYSLGGGSPYRYARAYTFKLLGQPLPAAAHADALLDTAGYDPLGDDPLEDAPIEMRAGDLFLGLDLFTTGTAQNRQLLHAMRRRGVHIHFVVYDLLPVLRPDFFPVGADNYFVAYLDTISAVSDSLVCISRAVADELHDWLAARPHRQRDTPLPLGYFHLGADLGASAPSTGLPPHADQVLAAIAARPSLLMVGTLEPRKGQAQALAAIDLLWQQGVDVNLVMVGKLGWMVDGLAQQLRDHPEREQRLFWLDGISDEMLGKLYSSCSALLAASVGEGFGLPLIEAAQSGLPIIARDLPVFQEVGGVHASYFSGTDAGALAAAVQQWLLLHAAGQAPGSAAMPWLSWQESTTQLVQALVGQRPYRALAAPSNDPHSNKVTP
jgi:glycosyltransferase involved in cell wall biosynthesis